MLKDCSWYWYLKNMYNRYKNHNKERIILKKVSDDLFLKDN